MITGNNEKPIKCYYLIDHYDGVKFPVEPKEGEQIVGIPYQWHSDNSYPFIEHRINGRVVKTVNALDCSEIVFE